MQRALHLLTLVFFCTLFFVYSPHNSYAQDSAGIGLKPATIEESVDPGDEMRFEITVTNLRQTEQTFYIYKRNIVGVKNGGVPVFAQEGLPPTGYELVDWITVEETEINMAPGEEKRVGLILDVPEDASPGSHFGGVFISAEPPKLRTSGAGIGYEVANILSIRVAGDAVVNAMLRSLRTDNYVYSRPIVNFTATIRNDGNVLVRPFGPLEVFNMFGKRVAMLTFNESEAGVFPKTDRTFELLWEDDGTGFGRYEAVLSPIIGDEGAKQTISSTVTFWILPMNIIGPASMILLVILLATYFGVKLYVRRAMMQVSGGRRIVRRRGRQQSSPIVLIMVVMLSVTAIFLIILLALFA